MVCSARELSCGARRTRRGIVPTNLGHRLYTDNHAEYDQLAVWDVFLLDSDFKIERPKRYYRQGLGNLLHPEKLDEMVHSQRSEQAGDSHSPNAQHLSVNQDPERRSVISSIRTHVSKIFSNDPSNVSSTPASNDHRHASTSSSPHRASSSNGAGPSAYDATSDSADDEMSSNASSTRPSTPMLDPSTNANPLVHADGTKINGRAGAGKDKAGDSAHHLKKLEGDMSKHTFYVVNSQMRLKLIAKNEVSFLTDLISPFEKHPCFPAANAAIHYST